MDLTGKTDTQNKLHNILGIIDHGSRNCLCLKGLKSKASITLLRYLLDMIEHYGKPKIIRTDNEAVFTLRLFRFGLSWLNIKHQKVDKGCPWQNGRVERFFGTLKEKLNQWDVDSRTQLNGHYRSLAFGITMYGHINISMVEHQQKYGKVQIFINKKLKRNIFLKRGMGC